MLSPCGTAAGQRRAVRVSTLERTSREGLPPTAVDLRQGEPCPGRAWITHAAAGPPTWRRLQPAEVATRLAACRLRPCSPLRSHAPSHVDGRPLGGRDTVSGSHLIVRPRLGPSRKPRTSKQARGVARSGMTGLVVPVMPSLLKAGAGLELLRRRASAIPESSGRRTAMEAADRIGPRINGLRERRRSSGSKGTCSGMNPEPPGLSPRARSKR